MCLRGNNHTTLSKYHASCCWPFSVVLSHFSASQRILMVQRLMDIPPPVVASNKRHRLTRRGGLTVASVTFTLEEEIVRGEFSLIQLAIKLSLADKAHHDHKLKHAVRDAELSPQPHSSPIVNSEDQYRFPKPRYAEVSQIRSWGRTRMPEPRCLCDEC